MKYLGILCSAILLLFAAHTFAPERAFGFGGGGSGGGGGGGGGGGVSSGVPPVGVSGSVVFLSTPLAVQYGGTQCGTPTVVASLPSSPTQGQTCNVTDAMSCVAGTAVSVGGGSTKCQVTWNGTSWLPAGGVTATSVGISNSGTGLNTTNNGTTVNLNVPVAVNNGGTQCGANTFATLPSSTALGTICTISNASACTAGTAVTSSGSTPCQLTWNGSNWMPAGSASSSASGGLTSATAPLTASGSAVGLTTPLAVQYGGTQCGAPSTYSSLPGSPTNGETCTVTDAIACYPGTAITAGGGSIGCQVVYNGTSWMPSGAAGFPVIIPALTYNDSTDDSTALNSAISSAPVGSMIQFPSHKTIKINTGIADTTNVGFNFNGSCLDSSGLTGNNSAAFTITSASPGSNVNGNIVQYFNICLKGPGSGGDPHWGGYNSGTTGLLLQASNTNIESPNIQNYNQGIDFGNNAYGITIHDGQITSNFYNILFPNAGLTNAGENIFINGGSYSNGSRGIENDGGEFNIVGVSDDYNSANNLVTSGGVTHMGYSHVEGTFASTPFLMNNFSGTNNNYNHLSVDHVEVVDTTTPTTVPLVVNNATGGMYANFNDILITGFSQATTPFSNWCTGAGCGNVNMCRMTDQWGTSTNNNLGPFGNCFVPLPVPLTDGGTQTQGPVTFANLPSPPVLGMIATVTDSASGCVQGTAITAGNGSTKCNVWYNGTSWLPAGGASTSSAGGFTVAGTGLAGSGNTVSLMSPVAVANGGTNATSAGATAANNIGALAEASNLSDLASASTARTNLGLGAAALLGTPIPVASGGTQCGAPVAYASLPGTPTNGEICNVTDSSVGCVAGTQVNAGGGSTKCQVTYNGTGWFPAGGATSAASGGLTTAGIGLNSSSSTVNLTVPVTVAHGGTQCGAPSVYASLPGSPTNGEICTVTDANGCVAGIAVSSGGGSTNCQVTYNGTSWMPGGGVVTPTSSGQTCTPPSCSVTNTNVSASATSGAIAVNLPAATGSFNPYKICKTDSSANTVTVTPNGGDLIDGNANFLIRRQNRCVQVTDIASGKWQINNTWGIDSIRLVVPIAAAPSNASIFPNTLLETVDFPSNFQQNFFNPTSYALCLTNPSEVDAYRICCTSTPASGCNNDIGSYVTSTAGVTTFRTGTMPWVRGSTQAPGTGNSGGSINVPTGVTQGDLLALFVVQASSSCQAATAIMNGNAWTLPSANTHTFTASDSFTYSACIYTRVVTATAEPASYSLTCSTCYSSMTMLDIANAANSTSFDVNPVWNHGSNGTNSVVFSASGTLNHAQDLYLGGMMIGASSQGTPVLPSTLISVQNIPYTGTYNGLAIGQLPLTATSQGSLAGSVPGNDWISVAFAVAPATDGGAMSCAAQSMLESISPNYTSTGVCPATLGGDAS